MTVKFLLIKAQQCISAGNPATAALWCDVAGELSRQFGSARVAASCAAASEKCRELAAA